MRSFICRTVGVAAAAGLTLGGAAWVQTPWKAPDAEKSKERLRALLRTHRGFGFRHPRPSEFVNRDHDLLAEPQRSGISARWRGYLERWLAALRDLAPSGRPDGELFVLS